jgi:ABC-2 type transport system permease protein
MIYLLLIIYVALSVSATLYASDFWVNTDANMIQFFRFQPAALALIIPAVVMRLWADEYKQNTLEVILSQSVVYRDIVLGKFLAAWLVVGVLLLATMPFWWIVAFFIDMNNLIVLVNYFIVFWVSGCLCALSFLVASLCYNVLGAFLLGMISCSIFISVSFKWLVDMLIPDNVVLMNLTNAFNFSQQYNDMISGQINISSIVYFLMIAVLSLVLSVVAVRCKRI